jgi:dihydroflavonol-4-reductase
VRRVLVTGANGFIGAHLLSALNGAGCETIGAVRPGSKLLAPPGASTVTIDMDDVNASAWAATLEGVDCVVNTAGRLRRQRRAIDARPRPRRRGSHPRL